MTPTTSHVETVAGAVADLLQVVVLLQIAALSVSLFKRVGLGPVVGHVAAGMIVGPLAIGVIISDPHPILTIAGLAVGTLLIFEGLTAPLLRLGKIRARSRSR